MKQINYVEYKHSYCHFLEPKLKCLNYNCNVLKKPVTYIKAIIRNTLNTPEVHWTEKELDFFDLCMASYDSVQLWYLVKNAVNKAKNTIVTVDDNGELIKH